MHAAAHRVSSGVSCITGKDATSPLETLRAAGCGSSIVAGIQTFDVSNGTSRQYCYSSLLLNTQTTTANADRQTACCSKAEQADDSRVALPPTPGTAQNTTHPAQLRKTPGIPSKLLLNPPCCGPPSLDTGCTPQAVQPVPFGSTFYASAVQSMPTWNHNLAACDRQTDAARLHHMHCPHPLLPAAWLPLLLRLLLLLYCPAVLHVRLVYCLLVALYRSYSRTVLHLKQLVTAEHQGAAAASWQSGQVWPQGAAGAFGPFLQQLCS